MNNDDKSLERAVEQKRREEALIAKELSSKQREDTLIACEQQPDDDNSIAVRPMTEHERKQRDHIIELEEENHILRIQRDKARAMAAGAWSPKITPAEKPLKSVTFPHGMTTGGSYE